MANDLGELSVKIGADASKYIDAFRNSQAALAVWAGQNGATLKEATSALNRFAADTKEHHARMMAGWKDFKEGSTSAMKGMVSALNDVMAAFAVAGAAMVAFGKEAIDAANVMDPAGADQWAQSTMRLKDAWVTFAGTIGKQVRPLVEEAMGWFVKLIHYVESLSFQKLIDQFKAFGQMLLDMADDLGRMLVMPFQLMQDAILSAITKGLELIGKVADFAKDKFGIGEGGDRFRSAADAAQKQGSPQIYDQLKSAVIAGATEAAKQLKTAIEDGAKTVGPDKHFATAGEISARTTGEVRAAKERAIAIAEELKAGEAKVLAAKTASALEIEAAHVAFATSNKTYEDKQRMLAADQAQAERMEAANQDQLAIAQKLLDAQNKIVESKAAQNAKDEALLASPAGHDPKTLALAQERSKIFKVDAQEQLKLQGEVNKAQTAADAAHLASVKAAGAIAISDAEHEQHIREAGFKAQGAAAEHAFNMSRQTFDDEQDLLATKLRIAQEEQKTTADQEAAAQKVTDAQNAITESRFKASQSVANAATGFATSQMGSAGNVVNAGIQGAATAGPAGAIVGVVTQLLQMSGAFKGITDALGTITQMAATIAPMIIAVAGLMTGNPFMALLLVFSKIAPLFTPLADSISKVMSGLGGGFSKGLEQLGKLLGYLGTSLQRAAEIFDPVTEIMQRIVAAIANSFGPIIAKLGNGMVEVAEILNGALAPVLPLLQTLFTQLANQLAGPVGKAIGTLWDVAVKFGSWILKVASGIDGVVATVTSALATVLDDIDKAAQSMGLGTPLKSVVEDLQTAYNTFTNAQYDAGQASSQLASATWQTISAQIALAQSTNDLNTQLTNVPTAFSVAQAYNQALQTARASGGAGGVGYGNTGAYGGLYSHGHNGSGDQGYGQGFVYENQANSNMSEENDNSGPETTAHRALIQRRNAGSGEGEIYIEQLIVQSNDPDDMIKKLRMAAVRTGAGPTARPTTRLARIAMSQGLGS